MRYNNKTKMLTLEFDEAIEMFLENELAINNFSFTVCDNGEGTFIYKDECFEEEYKPQIFFRLTEVKDEERDGELEFNFRCEFPTILSEYSPYNDHYSYIIERWERFGNLMDIISKEKIFKRFEIDEEELEQLMRQGYKLDTAA